MSARHTPGPWKREGLTIYAPAGVQGGGSTNGKAMEGNIFTATVEPDTRFCSPEEALATAIVMENATQLLAVCRSMRKALVDLGHDALSEAIVGDLAIAKVEGR